MSDSEHSAKEHSKGGGHGGGGHGGGGHGGGGHEEHEGAPEWLISFADNVTLMMGFFVIMLALNMKPASSSGGESESKQAGSGTPAEVTLDTVLAIREAFNNPVKLDSKDPRELALIKRLLQRNSRAGGGDGRFTRSSQHTI